VYMNQQRPASQQVTHWDKRGSVGNILAASI
jgi:hypothetical protein